MTEIYQHHGHDTFQPLLSALMHDFPIRFTKFYTRHIIVFTAYIHETLWLMRACLLNAWNGQLNDLLLKIDVIFRYLP